jgi:formyl-CoA transferase
MEHLEQDPAFNSHSQRCCNNVKLISILEGIFRNCTLSEWVGRLRQTNLIWGSIATYAEVAADPQAWANDCIIKFNHSIFGTVTQVGLPVKLSKTPGTIRTAAPELGQHTEEVLLEIGYDWDEIVEMKNENVIL